MRLAVTMRTANRAPKRNYLRSTLLGLQRSGADLTTLHLCLTDPRAAWLDAELAHLPRPVVHVPEKRIGANENGLSCVAAGLTTDAEMILILEDDLAVCADFLGSLSRWLDRHARPDRHVYRCFGFTTPPKARPAAYDWPLEGLRGSQAIVLWRDEAQDFLAWGSAHLLTWVPLAPWGRKFPHVTDPTVAFDKFVATWALRTWPGVPGVMSHPYFLKHIGDQSSLHAFGVRNDAPFAGETWAYA
jgi:hypothetical protein